VCRLVLGNVIFVNLEFARFVVCGAASDPHLMLCHWANVSSGPLKALWSSETSVILTQRHILRVKQSQKFIHWLAYLEGEGAKFHRNGGNCSFSDIAPSFRRIRSSRLFLIWAFWTLWHWVSPQIFRKKFWFHLFH